MRTDEFIEQLFHSTFRIELLDQSDTVTGIGTGFLIEVELPPDTSSPRLILISNRHVFDASNHFALTFHKKKSTALEADLGESVRVNVSDYRQYYFVHPSSDVDLACVNISHFLHQDSNSLFFKSLESGLFADFNEQDVHAGQQVIFVGYPDNRYDRKNNLPILRSGVIASNPKVDYNGKPEFIIDAQVFPGSSGSPVFLNLRQSHWLRGIHDWHGPRPFLFLGVLAATMVRNNIVEFIPTSYIPISREIIGLGIVYKTRAVIELLNLVTHPRIQ